VRLWTLHPRYLDRRGLVALWREGLLAQKVLAGGTRGYRRHPQLQRFRSSADPGGAIAAYLLAVAEEAARRGYRFDLSKIGSPPTTRCLEATHGQLAFEWEHLLRKLSMRDPGMLASCEQVDVILPHPLFHIVPGPIAEWERGDPRSAAATD
jgi:hypothetical protein